MQTTASQHWDGHQKVEEREGGQRQLGEGQWRRKEQGRVEELGSSQSGGTEHGLLVGKRDGLMHLLARPEMMMMK